MYNLVEYSDNYSKTSEILWKYCRDKSAIDDNGAIVNLNGANVITDLFKIKVKMTGQTGDNGTKNVKIKVPLK